MFSWPSFKVVGMLMKRPVIRKLINSNMKALGYEQLHSYYYTVFTENDGNVN